jgi:hypothetical protein
VKPAFVSYTEPILIRFSKDSRLTANGEKCEVKALYGRVVAQTAEARVRVRVDRVALGQVFFEYLGSICHSFIPSTVPQSSASIIRGWYNRPMNGLSNRGFCCPPDQ